MTALIEKILLLGLGIFILISFMLFISPLIKQLNYFNVNEADDLNEILIFIEDTESLIKKTISEKESSSIEIYFPENLDCYFFDSYAKFEFSFKGDFYQKILSFELPFYNRTYRNVSSKLYTLEVTLYNSRILVEFLT